MVGAALAPSGGVVSVRGTSTANGRRAAVPLAGGFMVTNKRRINANESLYLLHI